MKIEEIRKKAPEGANYIDDLGYYWMLDYRGSFLYSRFGWVEHEIPKKLTLKPL